MRIQSILPLPHLKNLLVAMLIFLVAVRAGRVVDVVPVLRDLCLLLVLLPLLPAASLALLRAVEAIYIVVGVRCPVGQGVFGGGFAMPPAASGGVAEALMVLVAWESDFWPVDLGFDFCADSCGRFVG